jgi:hypothetical protein
MGRKKLSAEQKAQNKLVAEKKRRKNYLEEAVPKHRAKLEKLENELFELQQKFPEVEEEEKSDDEVVLKREPSKVAPAKTAPAKAAAKPVAKPVESESEESESEGSLSEEETEEDEEEEA